VVKILQYPFFLYPLIIRKSSFLASPKLTSSATYTNSANRTHKLAWSTAASLYKQGRLKHGREVSLSVTSVPSVAKYIRVHSWLKFPNSLIQHRRPATASATAGESGIEITPPMPSHAASPKLPQIPPKVKF